MDTLNATYGVLPELVRLLCVLENSMLPTSKTLDWLL